jgi:dipeptidyl aminopeptidase/acylaminoacyl peptidase
VASVTVLSMRTGRWGAAIAGALALAALAAPGAAGRSPGPVHGPGTYVVDGHGGARPIAEPGYHAPTWYPRGHRLCMYGRKGPAVFTATGRLLFEFHGGCVLSPDARLTAFNSIDEQGAESLTVARVRGGGERRLVRDALGAEWSPDGRTIYYGRGSRESAPGFNQEVWAVDVDGGPARRILPEVYRTYGLSPDGRWILYNPQGQPDDHWIASTGGGGARFLARMEFADTVGWAPEDRGVFANGSRLTVHRLSGERRRPGLRVHGRTYQFAWSSDGARVAWTREQVGQGRRLSEVRVARPNGTRRRTLVRFTASSFAELYDLSWSADGKRLLVSVFEHEGD